MTDVKEVIMSNIQIYSCYLAQTETGMLYINYTPIFEKRRNKGYMVLRRVWFSLKMSPKWGFPLSPPWLAPGSPLVARGSSSGPTWRRVQQGRCLISQPGPKPETAFHWLTGAWTSCWSQKRCKPLTGSACFCSFYFVWFLFIYFSQVLICSVW